MKEDVPLSKQFRNVPKGDPMDRIGKKLWELVRGPEMAGLPDTFKIEVIVRKGHVLDIRFQHGPRVCQEQECYKEAAPDVEVKTAMGRALLKPYCLGHQLQWIKHHELGAEEIPQPGEVKCP